MPWLFQIAIPSNRRHLGAEQAGRHLDVGRWLGAEHIDRGDGWSTSASAWHGTPQSWAVGGAPRRLVAIAWRTTPQHEQRANHLGHGQRVEHLGHGRQVEHLDVGDNGLASSGSDDDKDKSHPSLRLYSNPTTPTPLPPTCAPWGLAFLLYYPSAPIARITDLRVTRFDIHPPPLSALDLGLMLRLASRRNAWRREGVHF
jgi:hypothetical protein